MIQVIFNFYTEPGVISDNDGLYIGRACYGWSKNCRI